MMIMMMMMMMITVVVVVVIVLNIKSICLKRMIYNVGKRLISVAKPLFV